MDMPMQNREMRHQKTAPHNNEAENKAEMPLDASLDVMVKNVVSLARDVRVSEQAEHLPRIFKQTVSILENSGRALFASDVAAILIAFIVGGLAAWSLNTYILHESFQAIISMDTLTQFGMFATLGAIALFWLDAKGHYRHRLPYWEMVGNILMVTFIGVIMGGFIQFAAKSIFSRLWLGFSWSLFAVFVFTGRVMVRNHLEKLGQWKIPSLVIGNGATADAAIKTLAREKQMGFTIARQMGAEGLSQFTKPRAWQRMMMVTGIGHIFLALEGSELDAHKDLLKTLVRERVPYSIIPPWLGLPSSTLSPHHFMMQDVLLLHNTNQLSLPLPRFLKRSFDIIVAGAALLCLAVPFAILALFVKRDGGPAFFVQKRVGMNGTLFNCYKFRSMKIDAEEALKTYLAQNPDANDEWNKFQKLKIDPRITAFGDFIRRTSIDELPQLINVIKGDMSLVGPRPIMQGQEALYEDDFSYYSSVRPGITGPWQVSGRNQLTFKQRVALEAWYARNWSPWMDIVILLKTIPVLLKKDQAF
jgi:Undecaprenyl-phosphate galactose phosphotransferase WbaP